ncbi:MAG: 30S ribosomal protein S2 [Verrucomicrobiales bacterium]|nr:30S ribosomal protein S2 [Verrucomicrobiales bacterium]
MDLKSTKNVQWQIKKGFLPKLEHILQVQCYGTMFADYIPIENLNIVYVDNSDIVTYKVQKHDLTDWIKTRIQEIENSVEKKLMSKSELASLNREREKLLRNLRGVRNMRELPQAVVIVDSAREHIAVNESRRLNIPVVAMIDSNADPTHIKYPIPANDDAIRSIRIVLQNLIDPVIAATDGGKLVKKKRPDIDAA